MWFEPANENKWRLVSVLKEFEFDKVGIEYIAQLDFTKHLTFHFWEESERVDCLTYISNVIFEDAFNQKITLDIEGIKVPTIILTSFNQKLLAID